ncbi:MAG: ACT domain-containing protein [Vulcanisaeta sp. AZ3]|jgi:acetolactate synthase II small subunit|nr:MAG: hypothetical protein TU36_00620 [Vulcanisaeta sp. AZ3]
MNRDFSIDIMMNNEVNPLDAVVRAMNIVRRGKIIVKNILIDMNDSTIKVSMRIAGDEDEVKWVCNKLDKLYDVTKVKYTQVELQSKALVVNNG